MLTFCISLVGAGILWLWGRYVEEKQMSKMNRNHSFDVIYDDHDS